MDSVIMCSLKLRFLTDMSGMTMPLKLKNMMTFVVLSVLARICINNQNFIS